MTRPVFLAPDLSTAAPGTTAVLLGAEAHHAATVRRLRPGERVDVVDGAGRRVTGSVTEAATDRLAVLVEEVADEPAPTPSLTLVQALAKGGRDEQAVEQATELGVDAVVPWQADRSVVRWDRKADKGREKWQGVARAAAKQSRRSRVPAVAEVLDTRRLETAVAAAVAAGELVLVLHESAATGLVAEVSGALGTRSPARAGTDRGVDDAAPPPVPALWCVVGPEGGITADELERLVAAGARPVLLGPHVLRSSSAGPAAVAALSVLLGRW